MVLEFDYFRWKTFKIRSEQCRHLACQSSQVKLDKFNSKPTTFFVYQIYLRGFEYYYLLLQLSLLS
jgi:hypothetical protein